MTLAEVVRHARIERATLVNLWANSPTGLQYVGRWTVGTRTLTCMGKTFAQVKAFRSQRVETAHRNLDWQDLAFQVVRREGDWVLKARTSTEAVLTRRSA